MAAAMTAWGGTLRFLLGRQVRANDETADRLGRIETRIARIEGHCCRITRGTTVSSSGDRGFRNNNPGTSDSACRGRAMSPMQTDPSFVQFTAPQWGIRAIAKILTHYQTEGFNTVRKIINQWAPPNENDTDSYIRDVAALCEVTPDTPIDVKALFQTSSLDHHPRKRESA